MGFPFGNALAAIKDENVVACFKRLGAAVHENRGTTSTLIRESTAQEGSGFELQADHDADLAGINTALAAKVGGSGTPGRIPVWTGVHAQGNSAFADFGSASFVATLDASLLSANARFRFQDPDPTYAPDGYIVTGVGAPSGVAIFGSTSSDISFPTLQTVDTTLGLSYGDLAGSATFNIQGNVEVRSTTGSNSFKIGDIDGGGSGNGFLTVSLAARKITYAISGTGAHQHLFADDVRIYNATATRDGIILAGRVGGTSTRNVTLIPTSLGADRTLTLPDRAGTVAVISGATYTPTNVTTDRSYDANATTLDELADVVGTLIADMQAAGYLQ